MPQEIERRWLLPAVSEEDGKTFAEALKIIGGHSENIKQGYFEVPNPKQSFRIRARQSDWLAPWRYFMTVKAGEGVVRNEFEEEVTSDFGAQLIELAHHRISKTRYHLPGGWEVDVFSDVLAGIILAEKEFSDVEDANRAELNPWLKDRFPNAREVTDSLSNLHLARLATDLRGTEIPALPFVNENLNNQIKKVVLTGGPCSGKSTAIAALREKFPDIHFVPEVASIVIGQLGIAPTGDKLRNRKFQQTIYRVQDIFEATSTEYAIAQGKSGIVLDRGTVDGAAYFEGGVNEFEAVLQTSLTREYNRYHAVLQLNIPPETVYEQNRRNNPARSETYSQAAALSRKIQEVWSKHPRYSLITSHRGWQHKLFKISQALSNLIP